MRTKKQASAVTPEIVLAGDPTKRKGGKGRKKVVPPAVTPDILRGRLFISVREYAALTGVPEATIYSLINADKISGTTRIGNAIRIPVSALTALVA